MDLEASKEVDTEDHKEVASCLQVSITLTAQCLVGMELVQ